MEQPKSEGWTPAEAASRVPDVGSCLANGRLVAWGRVGSKDALPSFIPASTWLDTIYPTKPAVSDPLLIDGQPIFDVRIFPILHSPSAAVHLNGLSLADAFRRHVIGDCEVRAMEGRILEIRVSSWMMFIDGRFPGTDRDLHWPLHTTAEEIVFGFMSSRPDRQQAGPLDVEIAISRVLAERIAALIYLLARGEIDAFGTVATTGAEGPIGRGQRARKEIWLDVCNSDICEKRHRHYAATWTGIVLRRAGCDNSQHRVTSSSLQEVTPEPGPAESIPQSTVRAERECTVWLEGIVGGSPDIRTRTDASLLEDAQSEWPGLRERAFLRALATAIRNKNADTWKKGGRPKKTSAV